AAGELAAEAGCHRDGEGQGLARAGLAAAEHVAPGEGVWQGVDLDREWAGDATLVEGVHQRGGHAERAEGCFSHVELGAFQASFTGSRQARSASADELAEIRWGVGEGGDGHIRSP